ncbi:MAG: aldose 1-epimerase family protein [Firmicutes bacterium]|nr:aldose 1-epimerase family protein [Bacillota bacterium]
MEKRKIGEEKGKAVYEYVLKNTNGVEVHCLNYGCAISKIIAPDRNGLYENIVLGFSDLESYTANLPYLGVVVGRVAGRIGRAQFELANQTYILAKNDGNNHLHGGPEGFHKVVWEGEIPGDGQRECVAFTYTSRDGEEGYPGNVAMKITYALTGDNQFIIEYQGRTDQATLLNPTNHTYFNLSGGLKRDILEHNLRLASDEYIEINEQLLPTGKLCKVDGTVFDFRAGRSIRDGVISSAQQNILAGKGYDHPFVLSRNNSEEIVLWEETSGRKLTIETDTAGVVLYTGSQLPDTLRLNGGQSRKFLGLCLETQGLPDSIHHSHFPSCILNKDELFSMVTKYRFSVM